MAKIVLNGCYGGFGLSTEAMVEILKRKGVTPYVFKEDYGHDYIYDNPDKKGDCYYDWDFERTDSDVIAVVEQLGKKANGSNASLFIKEYDDENFSYWIDEYDGIETLMLEPIVSEKKLLECKDVSEIITYLESLDIEVKMMNA